MAVGTDTVGITVSAPDESARENNSVSSVRARSGYPSSRDPEATRSREVMTAGEARDCARAAMGASRALHG